MKKTLTLLLVTIILLLSVFPAMAADVRQSGLFSYTMKGNGTAIIVGLNSAQNGNSDVYVPAQIDGYTVSEIGAEAFMSAECECVVMLPETITTIGERAFYASAFTSVQIPASVKVIGTDAFAHMTNIKKMSVDSKNAVYATIDGILYNKQTKALIAAPFNDSWDTVSITIPNGIKEIGEGAFAQFSDLEVKMPTTLTTISSRAFEMTFFPQAVTLPESIESIGERAFYQSRVVFTAPYEYSPDYFFLVDGIYLPSNVKRLGNEAFAGCKTAMPLDYIGYIDLSDTQLVEIPYRAFAISDSASIDYIYLPDTLKTIGDSAFASINVGRLNGLTLPASVESIGSEAFLDGYGTFRIPDNSKLRSIGERAFAGFSFNESTKVWEYSDYEQLGEEAYLAAVQKYQNSIVLPNGLETIGKEAFANIKGIERIFIPSTVTYIGDNFCNRADIILEVEAGSYAEFWASENGYTTNFDSNEDDTSWLLE